jgi:hypothetical protein
MLLRVEGNPNCVDLEPTEIQELSPPVEISRVRVRWNTMPEGAEVLMEELVWASIRGWSSQQGGRSVSAYAQRVISEGDEGVIIYGGDWGLKILVKNEEIGRNVLWVALDIARDNLPAEALEKLGLSPC